MQKVKVKIMTSFEDVLENESGSMDSFEDGVES